MKITGALYIIAAVFHIVICGLHTTPLPWLEDITIDVVAMYNSLGFKWSDKVAYTLIFALFSGVIVNVVRLVLDSAITGLRRVCIADARILYRRWIILLLWLLFCFFAVGAWGANESYDFEKFYILNNNYVWGKWVLLCVSLTSFLFGLIVNCINDVILATISATRR